MYSHIVWNDKVISEQGIGKNVEERVVGCYSVFSGGTDEIH
jgi:hypothetical protein